jgi:hypothetical protein
VRDAEDRCSEPHPRQRQCSDERTPSAGCRGLRAARHPPCAAGAARRSTGGHRTTLARPDEGSTKSWPETSPAARGRRVSTRSGLSCSCCAEERAHRSRGCRWGGSTVMPRPRPVRRATDTPCPPCRGSDQGPYGTTGPSRTESRCRRSRFPNRREGRSTQAWRRVVALGCSEGHCPDASPRGHRREARSASVRDSDGESERCGPVSS